MQKMNNKGLTIIEIVVTFSMIMFFCIGLLVIVNNYRNKVTVSLKKLDLDTFKNSITQDVNNDLLKQKYKLVEIVQASDGNPVGNCTEQLLSTLNRCINFKYYNTETGEYENRAFGTSKTDNTRQSYENKYIYYDGIKYPLKEKLPKTIPTLEDGTQRKYRDFQTITVMDDSILQETSVVLEDGTKITVYRIDVNISHLDFEDDFGIHIVATTDAAPTMKEPPAEEDIPIDDPGNDPHNDPHSTAPDTISSCPGCVYAFPTEKWKFANSLSTAYGDQGDFLMPLTVVNSNEYTTNWKEVPKVQTGKHYFVGIKLKSDNTIERAYACGVLNEIPFCIEGNSLCTNGSTMQNPVHYNDNQSVLLSNDLYGSKCTSSNSFFSGCAQGSSSSFPTLSCSKILNGTTINFVTKAKGNGYVFVGYFDEAANAGCIVYENGLIQCK